MWASSPQPNLKGVAGEVRLRVIVRGRVQGVFFRMTCAREARAQGVSGSVRNLPDGSVEAVLEGSGPAVQAMVEWCRQGPPGAHVDSVDVSAEPPLGLEGFSISG
jgi:acylphosphatase